MIALDSETNGLDPHHGCKPFCITTCKPKEIPVYWEWEVDPLTREPEVPQEDVQKLRDLLEVENRIIFHNAKFDVRMLSTIGIDNTQGDGWDWSRTEETTVLAHMVRSDQKKDLETLCLEHLGLDLEPFNLHCAKIVKQARSICRSKLPDWRIAKEGLPELPSNKGSNKDGEDKLWKADLWLPKAIIKHRPELVPEGQIQKWQECLEAYANADSESTLFLFQHLYEIIEKRNQLPIYKQRKRLLEVIYGMENNGVTLDINRTDELEKDLRRRSKEAGEVCTKVAKRYRYNLQLPKSGNNNNLTTFVFEKMKLPVVKKTDTGNPALDSKTVLPTYLNTLPSKSRKRKFVENLALKRKLDTQINYIEGYRRFMLPHRSKTHILYPTVNITGTNTLRGSSKSPNSQNISKQKDTGIPLRYMFGPAPGREWWALDFNNLELRIPAYECREPAMLELFERPNDPPYYGSYHLLVFSILYPKEFAKHGEKVKDIYKDTLYQWTKNGNFAEMYGAVDKEDGTGTADQAFHYPGAQSLVARKLSKKAALNEYWMDYARDKGYVETLPDSTVDSSQGYRLYVNRRRLSTTALNYHVQGTACWAKNQAAIKCYNYLQSLRNPDQYRMILEVHDELVFDLPSPNTVAVNLKRDKYDVRIDRQTKWGNPFVIGRDGNRQEVIRMYEKWFRDQRELRRNLKELVGKRLGCFCSPQECHGDILARLANRLGNLPKVRKLQRLMESCGDDIGIPLTVGYDYHPSNWGESE